MGEFFSNYAVRSRSPAKIAKHMERIAAGTALISTAVRGWVMVYDEVSELQDTQEIERIGKALSHAEDSHVLAFLMHDGSVFCYWLFFDGSLEDQFIFGETYLDGAEERADQKRGPEARKLAPLCVHGTTVEDVEVVLCSQANNEGLHSGMSELDRITRLADLLDIDRELVCLGYNSLSDDDITCELPGFKRWRRASAREVGAEGSQSGLAFQNAVMKGNVARVRELLNNGLNPNTVILNGATLLDVALGWGATDVAELLLDKGADLHAGNYECDPLTLATGLCDISLLERLINAGEDVNSGRPFSPLIAAAGYGRLDVVRLLLRRGADPNKTGSSGVTALMGAALWGHLVVVRELLEAGADPTICTEQGVTAAEMAALPLGSVHQSGYYLLGCSGAGDDRPRVYALLTQWDVG